MSPIASAWGHHEVAVLVGVGEVDDDIEVADAVAFPWAPAVGAEYALEVPGFLQSLLNGRTVRGAGLADRMLDHLDAIVAQGHLPHRVLDLARLTEARADGFDEGGGRWRELPLGIVGGPRVAGRIHVVQVRRLVDK